MSGTEARPAHRGHRDRGAVFLLTAIALPVLLLATSFAVDLGSQRALRRSMQAKADVIALDLARLIDGSAANVLAASPTAETALQASASRNGIARDRVSVAWGTLDPQGRFAPGTVQPATAVQVTTTGAVDRFFGTGQGHATRRAVGTSGAAAGFAIGSFAASVSSGSGTLLNSLIGNALGLGVLGYTGLASTNIGLLGISNQLGLATPTELLNSDVSVYQALQASAQLLQQNSANAAQVALLNQVLAVPNSPLRNVRVGDVVTLAAGGEAAAAAANVNVFDLLTAGAFLANGSSGLTVPATSLNLPGTNVTGSLNLIQHPQTAFGPIGTTARTAQASLDAGFLVGTGNICESTTNLVANLLNGVTGLLNLLLGAPGCGLLGLNKLVTVEVRANVSLNLAAATGTIDRIACPSAKELDIGVRSDLVSTNLSLSVLVKAGSTTIANVPLTVGAGGGAANGSAKFVLPPWQYGVYKPVNPGSGSLGLDTANVSGLGALGSLVLPIVNPLITTTVSSLNTNIVLPLSNALGLRVAGADVAPLSVTCSAVKLAG